MSTCPSIRISLMMIMLGHLSDEFLKKLSARASFEADDVNRSEAANTYSNPTAVKGRDKYDRYAEAMMKVYFPPTSLEDGVDGPSRQVRQSWVKLIGTQIKDGEVAQRHRPSTSCLTGSGDPSHS
jgi:hypothetical protein